MGINACLRDFYGFTNNIAFERKGKETIVL